MNSLIKKLFRYQIFLILFFFTTILADESTWFHSNGNYKSQKYSGLGQINSKNVSNLKLLWSYQNGYVPDKRATNQSIPIFTGSSLIVTSLDNYIIALDPEKGNEKWRTKLPAVAGKRGITFKKFNNERLIFVPTSKGIKIINEKNGKIFSRIGNKGTFGDTLTLVPPITDNKNIFVAFRTKIESFALNGNGKPLWSVGLNGARIWSGFSFDKKTNSLIAVTSNLVNVVGNTDIEPDYANSLLILDSISGKIKCKFQSVKHDHWDLDMVGNPIVYNSNEGKNIVFGFQKTGNIFVINTETCDHEFKNSFVNIKTKTSNKLNQTYSDSQIKSLKPKQLIELKYDLDEYLSYLENEEEKDYIKHKSRNALYNEDYIPISNDYDVLMYGVHGGPEWHGGALDKVNNQIIVPVNNYPWIFRSYYHDNINENINRIENNVRNKFLILKNKFFFKKEILKKPENVYLSPRQNQNKKISTTDKMYQTLFGLVDKEGSDIYKNKCQSCHGSVKQGFYADETQSDVYIPSLVGITLSKKSYSLKNISNFKYAHQYSMKKINLSEQELSKLSKYFSKYDNILNKFNLLGLSGSWQMFLDKNKLPASIPPWGKIYAIDIKSGKINWETLSGFRENNFNKKILGDMMFGGLLATGGNIFFATGTPDKQIRAYDSANGDELWSSNLPVAGSSSPMTYEHKDKQYIIVNASGGRYVGFKKEQGDYILAFSLK